MGEVLKGVQEYGRWCHAATTQRPCVPTARGGARMACSGWVACGSGLARCFTVRDAHQYACSSSGEREACPLGDTTRSPADTTAGTPRVGQSSSFECDGQWTADTPS